MEALLLKGVIHAKDIFLDAILIAVKFSGRRGSTKFERIHRFMAIRQ